jgi:uncharacterized protein
MLMTKFKQALRRAARAAAVAVALVALGPPAYAQPKPTPAAMAAAQELIKITGATALFNPLIPGVVEQAKLLFLQQNPSLGKDLNEVAAKLRAEYASRLTELTTHVADLYTQRFTEAELKQLVAFYQSPLGKKLQAQQPEIVDSSMKYAQDWANDLSDKVIAKMREEMKKRGHSL